MGVAFFLGWITVKTVKRKASEGVIVMGQIESRTRRAGAMQDGIDWTDKRNWGIGATSDTRHHIFKVVTGQQMNRIARLDQIKSMLQRGKCRYRAVTRILIIPMRRHIVVMG